MYPDDLTMTTPGAVATKPEAKRLPTGAIVAGRYRLVAMLGKGGMGEVYRAEDLTLDQPVALKFLPEAVVGDSARLTQFHNELRTARQVSHKNVVRLYDLGEADGRPFLTMEYVDGEDLGALLRRIGRFPADKAIDIARQLCAGVAAAHERGVIHRDLKPANVMLDGDGNVRITDFGIATALRHGPGQADDGGLTGTPQYMAPEMLTGTAASTKTDIYALGLILFEIFTGHRAYDAKSIGELKQLHETGTLTTPSTFVRDLDPAIERVILRCIDRDAAKRPGSALAVAAALPGGDPLAEALAAGETPSPDMLVAAGETDVMPVAKGLMAIGALVAALAVYAWLSPIVTLADLAPLDKPPAVLADRAQQLLVSLGYDEAPTATAGNFMLGPDYPLWLAARDATVNRWNRSQVARGPALEYWYRTSPAELEPVRLALNVSPDDPPYTVSGMSLVVFDSQGRLQEFHRVPPQRDPPFAAPPPAPAPQWKTLFDAAGLSMNAFSPSEPEWTPSDFADTRAAWRGPMPGAPDIELRVEAAAYRGKAVSFYLVGPWSHVRRTDTRPPSNVERLLSSAGTLLWITVFAGAALLARHNVRADRADRRTAARLVVAVIANQVVAWIIAAPHSGSVGAGFQSFLKTFGQGLLGGSMMWMLYVALEPYARRFWPDGLLGWTRLWSGRVRDPRIGRDIIAGSAFGAAIILLDLLRAAAPRLVGRPTAVPPLGWDVGALAGPTHLFVSWDQQIFNSLLTALLVVMLFVGLRLLVRRTWLAVVIGVLVGSFAGINNLPPGDVWWTHAVVQLAAIGLLTLVIFRYGLLVTVVALLVDNIPTVVPIVAQPAWAATPGELTMGLVVALACFGYYAARAGHPLFGNLDGQA
jgi:serine/threonine-protein kinase